MNDLSRAIELLKDDNTCVVVKDNKQYIDQQKGIKPMVDFISNNIDLKGFSVADKIVGKAAAMLFIFAGIKEVYGEVMSISAVKLFEENNIKYKYKTKTDVIINRKGDDICPMEKAVTNINDFKQAYYILKEKVS